MPTYEYRCKACGHELELFQSMTAAPRKKCPSCGKSTLERLIGAGAGILFKGKGFYQTDYRSKSYQDAAKKENGGSPAPSAGSKDEAPAASSSNGAIKKSEPTAETSAVAGKKKKQGDD